MKDKDKLQHIPLKPDQMPERVWVELGDSSETSRVWPFSPATSNKAVPYVPAKLVSELEAENKALKQLVLDRIARDQLSGEMAGMLLGIVQFHDLPINAQGAIREVLDKWKALNDVVALSQDRSGG